VGHSCYGDRRKKKKASTGAGATFGSCPRGPSRVPHAVKEPGSIAKGDSNGGARKSREGGARSSHPFGERAGAWDRASAAAGTGCSPGRTVRTGTP